MRHLSMLQKSHEFKVPFSKKESSNLVLSNGIKKLHSSNEISASDLQQVAGHLQGGSNHGPQANIQKQMQQIIDQN